MSAPPRGGTSSGARERRDVLARNVRIRRASDNAVVSTYQLATSSSTTGAGNCAAMGTWHQHSIALPGTLGSAKVSYAFETGDAVYNGYAGWFIDDMATGGASATPPPTPASSAYGTPFSDATGWALSGLWATDATPSIPFGTPYTSSAASLNYNNGTNFSTGARTTGDARSPLVDLMSLQRAVVTFECMYETETTGPGYDKRFVVFESETGSVLAQHQLATSGGSAAAGACAQMGTWHEHTIAFDPTWRSARIVFRFDSVDAVSNSGKGWFVDDLRFDQPDLKSVRKDLLAGVRFLDASSPRLLVVTTTVGDAGLAPTVYYGISDGLAQIRLLDASGPRLVMRRGTGAFAPSYRIPKVAPDTFPRFGFNYLWPGWADADGTNRMMMDGFPDGDYTIDLVVDPDNRIPESDESNNTGGGIRVRIQFPNATLILAENP